MLENTTSDDINTNHDCTTCKYHTTGGWSEKPRFVCDGIINNFYIKQ